LEVVPEEDELDVVTVFVAVAFTFTVTLLPLPLLFVDESPENINCYCLSFCDLHLINFLIGYLTDLLS
jgi:hypothetical protein